jgi:hypothetical protein
MANEPIVNKSYSDQDLDLIESQLNVALEIAHSRFGLRNHGLEIMEYLQNSLAEQLTKFPLSNAKSC